MQSDMEPASTLTTRIDPLILERAARVIRILGHPLRLRILEQLEIGERNVADLQDELEASQAAISQQLAILRSEGDRRPASGRGSGSTTGSSNRRSPTSSTASDSATCPSAPTWSPWPAWRSSPPGSTAGSTNPAGPARDRPSRR